MAIIVAIILLGGIVIPNLGGPRSRQSPVTAAMADIQGGIKSALGQYQVDNGSYPSNLQDLVQKPSLATNWHGPYLDKIPVDPWGNNYIYTYPGIHNANSYDLASAGPDGKVGTEDDIVSWK